MANLVKISQVYLYIGATANTANCDEAKKLLDDSGIEYAVLEYNDPQQNVGLFAALNGWPFGNIVKDEGRYQVVHSDFPFLHWKEHLDDWEIYLHCAYGLEAIKTCSVLANKSLAELRTSNPNN